MWNDTSNNKKITFHTSCILVIVLIILSLNIFSININFNENSNLSFQKTYATNADGENSDSDDKKVSEDDLTENITDILDDIDSNELDDFLVNDFNLDFFTADSFKSLVSKILNGTYFSEYDTLSDAILGYIKTNFQSLLSVFLTLLCIVVLFELFNNFCVDKYNDLKKVVKIIFALVLILVVMYMLTDIAKVISSSVEKIFNFAKLLFPILLNLILLSGASGTYSVYSALSVFLLNTGAYVFVYVLLPLSISIMFLSLFGSAFASSRFSKFIDLLKTIFKYIIAIFFGIFGIFSAVNLISSGVRDGVSLKLTKYAIKNYIPILGGYISDGFDFVHSCSVLVKNAFGVCGILVLVFMILKPLIMYFVYLLMFKILSIIVAFVGNNHYSDMFNNVSKCMSYFIAILIGIFMILFIFIYLLVLSVSVV